MRVLLLGRFDYSGLAGRVFSLAEALNRQGLKTAVILTGCPEREAALCHRAYQTVSFRVENRFAMILARARWDPVNLIHLHSAALLPPALELAAVLRVPLGLTVTETPAPVLNPLLKRCAFIIAAARPAAAAAAAVNPRTVFIPEGVDLEAFRPAPKEGFRITFVGEGVAHSAAAYRALRRAAVLADWPVDVICPDPLPVDKGFNHGWLPHAVAVLRGAQIVAGRGRALLEGMACGNAALILGQSYGGLLEPSSLSPGVFPDLSGRGSEEPCYRSIFYDLAALWKDRGRLPALQQWGRRFVVENCDLRLVAESTSRLYRAALSSSSFGAWHRMNLTDLK